MPRDWNNFHNEHQSLYTRIDRHVGCSRSTIRETNFIDGENIFLKASFKDLFPMLHPIKWFQLEQFHLSYFWWKKGEKKTRTWRLFKSDKKWSSNVFSFRLSRYALINFSWKVNGWCAPSLLNFSLNMVVAHSYTYRQLHIHCLSE